MYNFNGPLLNRSRLFMHSLQLENNLGWDDILDKSKLNEWKNISKQANNAPVIKIKRCLGERDDDYRLISFCDSSKLIFGFCSKS